MEISVAEVAAARETVAELLEKLRVDACLFDLEPRQNDWAVTIECAIEEGWEALTLNIARQELSRAHQDERVREALLRNWRERLAMCKRRS